MWFLGLFALAGGVYLLFAARVDLNRRKRIIDTPTSPIASAPGTGPVEIKGRIAAAEEGTLRTPIGGAEAVWFRVTVQEYRSSGKSGKWVAILSETDGRWFHVDDGSGQIARVKPTGAHVLLDPKQAAKSGTFNDATPALEEFLTARGQKSTGFFGFNRKLQFLEEVLAPGDDLYAIGPSRREPGPPTNDLYRTTPTTRLVLEHGGPGADELILTNKTEEELVKRLRLGLIAGLAALGFGVFAIGVSIFAH